MLSIKVVSVEYLLILSMIDEDNHNSDLHPDDPKNIVPLNQIEFKQRVIRGSHQPDLEFYPRSSFSGTQRSFQKSWFKLFSWLEYSPKFDLAFCFPCRMFNNSNGINVGQTDKAYTTTGYKNWKAATIKFKAHQMSKVHLNCITSLSNFLHSKPIDVLLDEERELTRSQREEQRLTNRKVIQRLIDVTLFLGIGGKPFRGHSEKKDDVYKGLFLGIVDLLKKYDPILKKHFETGPKNSIYCSNYIQNDLIASISTVIKRQLKVSLINEKVSIMADETSDVGHHEQLSVVIRYFDKFKNRPIE
ncbi:zinc finger MYM-type protein 1-like, partial [Aphis craccivora]